MTTLPSPPYALLIAIDRTDEPDNADVRICHAGDVPINRRGVIISLVSMKVITKEDGTIAMGVYQNDGSIAMCE